MRQKILGYMGGAMDGDGHFGITAHPYVAATIDLVGESRQLMNWTVEHFGGTFKKNTIPSGKDFYRWDMYGKNARIQFLDELIPYLVIKHEQAKIIREFLNIDRGNYNPELRYSFVEKIRASRASGSVETDMQGSLKIASSYTAGLIDTDGHIRICELKNGPCAGKIRTGIEVVNICKPALSLLQREYGGSLLKKTDSINSQNWHQRYRWIVTSRKEQERVLLSVIPYLIVKRDRAISLLEHLRSEMKIQPDTMGDHGREPAEMLAS
jgi:hypothetical protein